MLREIFDRLYKAYGKMGWWPGDTQIEIIVGAILTQNTAWKNVEKAIVNLKREEILTPKGLREVDLETLSELIKPSGYYNQKARKLKNFIEFLFSCYGGSIENMFKTELYTLREQLLSIKGIGEETADSILLYAGNMPIFVVDAYTRRILSRHNLIPEDASYAQIQSLFMESLPKDANLFNEYHALLVKLGKESCKKREPICSECPLNVVKVSQKSC
jgi:endonuclease-3 related protein